MIEAKKAYIAENRHMLFEQPEPEKKSSTG